MRLRACTETFGYFCSRGSWKEDKRKVQLYLCIEQQLRVRRTKRLPGLTISCGSGIETPQKNWLLLKTC